MSLFKWVFFCGCVATNVLAIHYCCPTPTCQRRSHARKSRGGGGEEDDRCGQGEVVDEGVGGGGGVGEEVARVRVIDAVERHFDGHDGALRGKGGRGQDKTRGG